LALRYLGNVPSRSSGTRAQRLDELSVARGAGRSLLATAALLLGASLCLGQATARRGDPQKGDTSEIGSPMVLEAPFFMADPAARSTDWRSSKEFVEFRAFRCQGLYVSGLMTRIKPAGAEHLSIGFRVILQNPNNNHDKAVRVEISLRNGDAKIGSTSFGPVKVEESDAATREVAFAIPVDALRTDPTTTVQLTVTAQDE
jgi:hypothetical protein